VILPGIGLPGDREYCLGKLIMNNQKTNQPTTKSFLKTQS
jgi:hypothetical protein